jgi:Type IV secretory pathway, VirD4 components
MKPTNLDENILQETKLQVLPEMTQLVAETLASKAKSFATLTILGLATKAVQKILKSKQLPFVKTSSTNSHNENNLMEKSTSLVMSRASMLFTIATGAFFACKKIDEVVKKRKASKTQVLATPSGIVFGKSQGQYVCSPTNEEGHSLVVGGTGSGKTSACLIPTLRAWKGTSFSIDISGDISMNVSMPNMSVIDPYDTNSTSYDIFGAIDDLSGADEQHEALERLAYLIIPENLKLDGVSAFYRNSGRQLLQASLIALYHQGLDFCEIADVIVRNNCEQLISLIESTNLTRSNMLLNSFKGTPKAQIANCKQVCSDAMTLFASPVMKNIIHRPVGDELCYTPASLENSNVFVRIPDDKLTHLSPFLSLIVVQTLEYLYQRPNERSNRPKILMSLDEFSSLGWLDMLPALKKLRKSDVRIMPLIQSLIDLDLNYNEAERNAMINNFDFISILNAKDVKTQMYFAEILGRKSEDQGSGYHIQPSELGMLGDDLILKCPYGHFRLKKAPYFNEDNAEKLATNKQREINKFLPLS